MPPFVLYRISSSRFACSRFGSCTNLEAAAPQSLPLPLLVLQMDEPCLQCGNPLTEPGCDFDARLKKLGGWGRKYCLGCWMMWLGERQGHDQPVTLQIWCQPDGCLAISCVAISGSEILSKGGLSQTTTTGDVRKWLEEDCAKLRQDRDGRFYTAQEYIEWHWQDNWLRNEPSDDVRTQ